MGQKRPVGAAVVAEQRAPREPSKRKKPSGSAQQRGSSSSDPDSAFVQPAGKTLSTAAGEPTNDSGSSSGDEQVEESSDAAGAIPTIGGPKKPAMRSADSLAGAQDLRARLAAFMPRMAQANDSLAGGGIASIEDVEDDEQHIEMNLGLGVLEEQRDSDDESSSGEESSDGEQSDSPAPQHARDATKPKRGREMDAMGKLMGNRTAKGPIGIHEIT